MSDGGTPIEAALQKYQSTFGLLFSQKVVAGYIIDLDQSDIDTDNNGFDLDACLADPLLAPWFHDPLPEMPESNQYTQALWRYATTAVVEGFHHENLTVATAYAHIDHVFFPRNKFDRSYYANIPTGVATDEGFESVLHEALHIWHFRNFAAVKRLLQSPGSYFDRVSQAAKLCSKYKSISSEPKAVETCGFKSEAEAALAVLKQGHWPQRYGSLTSRKKVRVKGRYGCGKNKEWLFNGKVVCVFENDVLGDLHAFDNEFEYFAILMQLYVLFPEHFKISATAEEAEFAQYLFRTEFGLKY